MDDLGVPLFQETSILIGPHVSLSQPGPKVSACLVSPPGFRGNSRGNQDTAIQAHPGCGMDVGSEVNPEGKRMKRKDPFGSSVWIAGKHPMAMGPGLDL